MRTKLSRSVWLLAIAAATSGALHARGEARPKSLIGLLDFPAIYAESNPDAAAQSLTVRAGASSKAAIIAQLDRKGIRLAGARDYSCAWTRDLDVSKAPMACVFAESGYEIPALAVFGVQGQWYRVALDPDRFGWVHAADGYHALADLLASSERLTYLTAAWDGRVYAEPGRAPKLVFPAERRRMKNDPTRMDTVPYKALAYAVVASRLWLKIEILDEVCSEHDPRVLYTGWVPAQSPSGELWAWFWSRGC